MILAQQDVSVSSDLEVQLRVALPGVGMIASVAGRSRAQQGALGAWLNWLNWHGKYMLYNLDLLDKTGIQGCALVLETGGCGC